MHGNCRAVLCRSIDDRRDDGELIGDDRRRAFGGGDGVFDYIDLDTPFFIQRGLIKST